MRLSLPLIVSLSLNVILAGGLLLGARHDSPAVAAPGDANDPARLFEVARGAGLSESLAYQLALIGAQPPIQAAAPAEYWTMEGRHGTTTVMSQGTNQELRSRLLKAFGEHVKDRPEFASLFKPFADKYPFLSAEKQLALQEILATSDVGVPAGRADVACVTGGCGDPRQKIRQLLTADEYFEYELREAPLSYRLVRTGVDFTEQEFREVFRVLTSASTQQSPAADRGPQLVEQERAITSILGNEKFAQYQRAQDPIYRALSQGGERYKVSRQAIDSAYLLIKQSQQRMAASNPSARATIRDELNDQLQSQIGADLAGLMSRYLDNDRRPMPRGEPSIANALLRARR